jgi:hypothetical protein
VFTNLQSLPTYGAPFTKHVIASDIKLGQLFSYQIKVSRNGDEPAVVEVKANNGAPAQMAMDAAWDAVTFYFKAGSYVKLGTSENDGGLVRFYRLAASHPANGLSISSLSVLPNARAGVPYSTTLTHRGGVGPGTWSLVSGFPPTGLSLDRNGLISGIAASTTISSKPNDFMVKSVTPTAVRRRRSSPLRSSPDPVVGSWRAT